MSDFVHIPVLLNQTVESFNLQNGDWFLDATLGGAGHAKAILSRNPQLNKYIGFDQDQEAIAAAKKNLKSFKNVEYVNQNFVNAPQYLEGKQFGGILADIGVSSHQIDTPERGFSFNKNGKLDMRMNLKNEFSAYSVINGYSEKSLADIIYKYGEEKDSRKIAAAIVKARQNKPIETTLQLQQIVANASFKKPMDAVQKTFQAIRIEVNDELEVLKEFITGAFKMLRSGGRLAIITFHSLEDRIVKNAFADLCKGCICPPSFPVCVCGHKPEGKLITKKPITATNEQIKENPRCACAKLRVIEKL